jgi:hypothetical protein
MMFRATDARGPAEGQNGSVESAFDTFRSRELSATDGPFVETKEGPGASGHRSRHPGARAYQMSCAVCGVPLATGRSVIFQGDHLVHATCWQAEAPGAPTAEHRGSRLAAGAAQRNRFGGPPVAA